MRFLNYLFFSLLIPVCSDAQTPAPRDTVRLLMIGNSFSANASRFLQDISRSQDFPLVIGKAEISGAPLNQHWDSVAVNASDSTRGRPYNGRSLREIIRQHKWDVISIQQASLVSGDVRTYDPFARNLVDFIRLNQPAARIVLHQTWPYRSDAPFFTRINGNVQVKDFRGMWQYSRAAYHSVAYRLGLPVVPVGDAFFITATDPVFAFRKDSLFNPAIARHPDLPVNEQYSLHAGYSWDSQGKLAFDAVHANDAGCFLAGLVWFGFLSGQDPGQVSFCPGNVDAGFAAGLRTIASGIFKGNYRDRLATGN
ncbi:MAG: DUF4886 domain-containing protein [Chitinophagaceae bacterium]|nr:MAG: DUF4886 domain-containing protein [Chitinophagaceae bacterium]